MSIRQCWHGYQQIMHNMRTVPLEKKSSILAVMGSGPSINELSSRDLDFLRNVDVFGFNFWAYHELIPDFYMYEAASDADAHREFFRLMKQREQEYKDVVFLAKGVPWFRRKGSLAQEFAKFPESLHRRIRLLRLKKVSYRQDVAFSPEIFHNRLPTQTQIQPRSSVSVILSLAYALGYKDVILYGIDMSDGGHFWDRSPKNSKGYHKLALTRKDGEFGLVEIISLYRQELYIPDGREIYVASTSSRLYPMLPLWEYQTSPKTAPAQFL